MKKVILTLAVLTTFVFVACNNNSTKPVCVDSTNCDSTVCDTIHTQTVRPTVVDTTKH
jgi:hypothetical protein